MSPSATVDLAALGQAITRSIVDGNEALVRSLMDRSDRNHDLRGVVQANTDKVYALDAEVKLLKGVIVALNGSGDGSSGSVPRLEAGVTGLRSDVAALSGEVGAMRGEMRSMGLEVKALSAAQTQQKSWTDGWKGVGVAITIMGACVGLMGAAAAAVIWLFSHGVKP
jgi:hypothetical protein